MKRKTIAVDCDDVLVAHFQGLIEWYNQKYGTALTEDHNHPKDITPWGTDSIEDAVRRVHKYYETSSFKAERPFDDALHALTVLAQEYELLVLTGRDEIIEEVTREWIEQHFPALFREVHFSRQYNLEGKSRSKAEVIGELQADYFIDDFLPAVQEVAAKGVPSILFGNYSWNQVDNLPGGVTRCKDWAAVLEYFDSQSA